jgi:hypothetical protein
MQSIDFFKKTLQKKDKFETFKLYRKLNLAFYEQNALMIKEGDLGDKFFIIIKGEAAVLEEGKKNETYANYYDLLMFMLEKEKFLLSKEKPLDSHSGCVQRFMNLIPKRELRRLNEKWQSLSGWITFMAEMINHLNTGAENDIAKYYGMDKSEQGPKAIENLGKHMTFLKQLLK